MNQDEPCDVCGWEMPPELKKMCLGVCNSCMHVVQALNSEKGRRSARRLLAEPELREDIHKRITDKIANETRFR